MKLRRSRIFWSTVLLFIFIPLMLGLLLFISRNPEISKKLGLVGTKAELFKTDDWSGFYTLVKQSIATIGLIGFGFVTTWVFGREYTDRTLKDILVMPVSRQSIICSKFVVVILWCFLLSIVFLSTSIFIGYLMNIPGIYEEGRGIQINGYFSVSLLTLALSTPVAFVCVYSRGLIAPLAFAILTLICAQFAAMTGIGQFFPWAVPGILTVINEVEGFNINMASYIILGLTSISGFTGTILWWRYADHH